MLTKEDLLSAEERIQAHLERTPILRSSALDEMAGTQLFFKAENFQKTGSFKARGALNAVLSLKPAERVKGVATHSSGNHGQALAWAASLVGIPAYIVMPKNAPKVKVAAVKGYGGTVQFCENNIADRESGLKEVQEKTGAHFIAPYDAWPTIAGQSTCAKEMLEEQPGLDAIIAPVGGGGLMAGTCLSLKYFSRGLAAYGAEPGQADDAYRSLKSGHLVEEHKPNTIADGLRTTLGKRNFSVLQKRLADLFLVEEKEIVTAMRLIWERMKIVVEPSCALPLAVVLKHQALFSDKKVGLILTGGNVDLESLPF